MATLATYFAHLQFNTYRFDRLVKRAALVIQASKHWKPNHTGLERDGSINISRIGSFLEDPWL
jgi:hypothetical protein